MAYPVNAALADAAFNAEKKRRKYDPLTGYYVDRKSGLSGPDVQPYERPGFFARLFSPEARELIAYNQQWVNKPREARLGRNIERDTAKEIFDASSPAAKKLIGTPENQYAVAGTGHMSGQTLAAHELGLRKVEDNFAQAQVESEKNQAIAEAVAQQNRANYENQLRLFGGPEQQAQFDLASLQDKLANVTQVSPYRRANEIVEQRDIVPGRLGNEAELIGINRRRMREIISPEITSEGYRQREIAPIVNQTDKSRALIGQRLADTNLGQADVLADTQRYQNIGNRLRSQYMGENPVTAMGNGLFGVINEQGGLDVRMGRTPTDANLNAADIAAEMGTEAGGVRYSMDGQPLPTPPTFLSAPYGTIGPQGTQRTAPPLSPLAQPQPLIGNVLSRGVSLNIPTPPIATPTAQTIPTIGGQSNWNINDIVQAQVNQQVPRLAPEQQQQVEALNQEFRERFNALPQGSVARKVVGDLLNQAIADEIGLQTEFYGDSTISKSAVKTVGKAMKDPVIAAKIKNLPPQQVARVYQKVWEGLIEQGLIKDERPELIGAPR